MGLGQDHGGFSPFDIQFQYIAEKATVEELEPFDPVSVACYEAISVRLALYLLKFYFTFSS